MKIRRYTCKDMQEALLKVKMDLGSEAVIMNSKKVKPKGLKGLFSKPMIEVVAAIDDDYVRPVKPKYNQRQVPVYEAYQPQPTPVQASVNEQSPVVRAQQEMVAAKAEDGKSVQQNLEHHKITELEEKVKSMENMLDKIYEVVQKSNVPNGEQVSAVSNQVSATSQKVSGERLTVSSAAEQLSVDQDQLTINSEEFEPSAEFETDSLISLRNVLFDNDVEPKLIEKILEKIRERGGKTLNKDKVYSLAAKVMSVLLGEPEPIKLIEGKKPHVAIFIGPTGVGKTTTLAKIAADFTFRQKKVGLITADTYRIAAVEQLKTYAEILNLKVTVVYSPSEIKDAVERLSDCNLILIDTAGRSHKNKTHFDELKALVNAVNADETYLVMSSNTSRIAIREILEYYAFIKNYKLLFTKLDESPVPGVILNARYMTGKPLSYTTAGQSVPDDLDIANIRQLVTGILNNSD